MPSEDVIDFGFPGTPYPVQLEFMKRAYESMTHGGLSILESPTGSGKSLSLLCSALAWLALYRDVSSKVNESPQSESDNDETIPAWVKQSTHVFGKRVAEDLVQFWKSKRESMKLIAAKALSKDTYSGISAKRKRVNDSRHLADRPGIQSAEEFCLTEVDEQVARGSSRAPEEDPLPNKVKIIVCSRTHSQLSQLNRELRKISRHAEFNIITLGSRGQLCVHPDRPAVPASTVETNEFCKNLVDENACEFKSATDEKLMSVISVQSMDIEDVHALASDGTVPGCPYYATRSSIPSADIIFVPYASAINEKTRSSLGIDVADNIFIVDEAHNILDAVASGGSATLFDSQVESLRVALGEYVSTYQKRLSPSNLVRVKQLSFMIRKLAEFLTTSSHGKTISPSEFFEVTKMREVDIGSLFEFLEASSFARKIRGFMERSDQHGKGSAIYQLVEFVVGISKASEWDKVIVCESDGSKRMVLTLVDAEGTLAKLVKDARAVLLVGGTMKPFEEFKAVAELAEKPFSTFTGKHSIPREHVLARIISTGAKGDGLSYNFSSRGDSIHRNAISDTLAVALSSVVSGGIVIFLPSYGYADLVEVDLKRVCSGANVSLFVDRGSKNSKHIFSDFSTRIASAGRAVLVSVVGGSLSEGIDFKDRLCRCVIMVGLPYSNKTDPFLSERMKFLDSRHSDCSTFYTGQQLYQSRCMRAVNQSIGRAVRHVGDWSAVILLDSRYSDRRISEDLTDWVREDLRMTDSFDQLRTELRSFCSRNDGRN